ncbi:hypothetical protein Tco_0394808 [Tanacetum coccineum]
MVALEDFPIPFLIPLNSIMQTVIRPPVIINNIPFDQYTTNLFSSGSSKYSPSPPPKVVNKGKGKIQETYKEDQMKQIMPLMEQGGSTPKISNLHQFSVAGEGPLTIKEANAQMEEIKRLAALKLEKEKTEKRLKKVMTRDEIKAQVEELAAYEAKRVKLLKEYNHCITFRDDPLPITKISYRRENEFHLATTPRLIIIHNAINVNSEIAKEMYHMMIYVIEARDDHVEVRKISVSKPKFLIKMSPRRSEGEESKYPFFEGDSSSSDEWEDYGVAGDNYEGPPVFDDDQYEEESMPIYDTNIEDVIEEEQKFVRKGGFGGEEDNTEDVVVVANDICSSMIQTTVSVDFSKTINSNPHKLIWLQKVRFKDDQGSRSSHYKEREFDARDTNLDATSKRDE